MPPRPRASSSTSTSASASKKRKTTSGGGDEAPPPPPTPSTSFFFADGNVLLQVESTLFKVHKSLLEKAEVFADTLLVGQGEEGGVPTIKLEDKEEDWLIFLRALYDGLSFSDTPPTLSQTHSLLLLSDKYNHPFIFKSARGLFLDRCRYEADLKDDPSPEDSRYPGDYELLVFTVEALRALLALQEKFGFERSSVRGVYNHLARLSTSDRADFLEDRRNEDVALPPWCPSSVSEHTRYSLLLRVEAVALLSARAFKRGDLHTATCGVACRRALVRFRKSVLFSAAAQELSYASSIELALRTLKDKEDEDAPELDEGCAALVLDFWKEKRKELEEEMKKDFGP